MIGLCITRIESELVKTDCWNYEYVYLNEIVAVLIIGVLNC